MNDLKNLNYGKFQDSKEIIDISLEFIISNKYEYGPDFEEKEKNYEVKKIDTSNVPCTTRAIEVTNVFRSDAKEKYDNKEEILQLAPSRENNFIKVPKIIKE